MLNKAQAGAFPGVDDDGCAVVTEIRAHAISVRQIYVLADIGIHSHEVGRPQPLVVDVEVEMCAPAQDAIDATLDYNLIVAAADELAKRRICLIETYCRILAEHCLSEFGASLVKVSVTKPQALRNGIAGSSITLAVTPKR